MTLSPGETTEEGFCAGEYFENATFHLSAKDIKRSELASSPLTKMNIILDTFKKAHEKYSKREPPNNYTSWPRPDEWTVRGVVVSQMNEISDHTFQFDPKIFLQPSAVDVDLRFKTNTS